MRKSSSDSDSSKDCGGVFLRKNFYVGLVWQRCGPGWPGIDLSSRRNDLNWFWEVQEFRVYLKQEISVGKFKKS